MWLTIFGAAAQAQTSPGATRGTRRLDVFGEGSWRTTQYHSQNLWGANIGAEVSIYRWVGLRGELDLTAPQDYLSYKYQLSEKDLFVGPIVKFHKGRFYPFGYALPGITRLIYPSTNFHDSEVGLALGGGTDYALSNRLSLRPIDFRWTAASIGSIPDRKEVSISAGLVLQVF